MFIVCLSQTAVWMRLILYELYFLHCHHPFLDVIVLLLLLYHVVKQPVRKLWVVSQYKSLRIKGLRSKVIQSFFIGVVVLLASGIWNCPASAVSQCVFQDSTYFEIIHSKMYLTKWVKTSQLKHFFYLFTTFYTSNQHHLKLSDSVWGWCHCHSSCTLQY